MTSSYRNLTFLSEWYRRISYSLLLSWLASNNYSSHAVPKWSRNLRSSTHPFHSRLSDDFSTFGESFDACQNCQEPIWQLRRHFACQQLRYSGTMEWWVGIGSSGRRWLPDQIPVSIVSRWWKATIQIEQLRIACNFPLRDKDFLLQDSFHLLSIRFLFLSVFCTLDEWIVPLWCLTLSLLKCVVAST